MHDYVLKYKYNYYILQRRQNFMAADNMKNFSISSLSEYITLVEKHNLTDFISRGEAEKHDAILASAFRPFAKHRKYYNEKHIKQFYDYIGNGLT